MKRLFPAGLVLLLLAGYGCQPGPIPRKTPADITPATGPAEPEVLPPKMTGGKPLLMHYMPWYKTPAKRGSWGSHWTGHERQHNPDNIGTNGLPDIWSHFHPLIGLYDSTDPDVLMCQLMQMKLAGVDGVIADWYGTYDTADYPEVHAGTTALLEAVKRAGMYFAVCYEDRSVQLLVEWNKLKPEETTNHLAGIFTWMQDNWFKDPHYYQFNQRPLLLNFGPIYLNYPDIWKAAQASLPVKPAFFALHHLWRKAGADGGFTWIHPEPWEGTPDERQIRTRIGEVFSYFSRDTNEVIVSAYPGFLDVYNHDQHPDLAYRDGATLRETLGVAMAGPWQLVQLVTWNDYGEGTMIEPTHEFGYTFLEIVQQARKSERGETFTYTPGDLRLPAEVLALAQSGTQSRPYIDYLWQMLAQGFTGIVAVELEKIREE